MDDPRVVKSPLPFRVILTAVAIGMLLLAFIIFAVWQSGVEIKAARMTGKITAKEFVPVAEEQIMIQRGGAATARKVDGDYIITVAVPQPSGTPKPYNVWISKPLYDSLNVGDNYDVGPALQK